MYAAISRAESISSKMAEVGKCLKDAAS